jgi:hypothetical protein
VKANDMKRIVWDAIVTEDMLLSGIERNGMETVTQDM